MEKKDAVEKSLQLLRRIYADEPIILGVIEKAGKENDLKYLSGLLENAKSTITFLQKHFRVHTPSQRKYIEDDEYREAHRKKCRERYYQRKKEQQEAMLANKRINILQ